MNVVFDFDKTLTTRDTTRRLFFYLGKQNGQSRLAYVAFYLLYRFGGWSEHRFKSSLVRHYLRGRLVSDVNVSTGLFVDDLMGALMNGHMLNALRQHLVDGDRVFLASANFEFLIKAFCELNGISDYFATSLETDAGRYTGKVAGPIVKGVEKLRTLESYFGTEGLRRIKFYGDAEDRVLHEHIPNHVVV